jgi:hypothetical protein
MDHGFLLFLGVSGMIAGLYLFVRGFFLMLRKQLIRNTPTSTVRAAAIGPVEVHGKATGPSSLISPLAQVDCYYYAVTAWQQVEKRNRRQWDKVAHEVLCVPFFIADGTGSMMVDARGAELSLPAEFESEVRGYETSESIRHFLGRHGIPSDANVRLKECVVRPDEALYVFGTLGENRGLGESSEGSAHEQTRMLSREAADLQRRVALDIMQVELPGGGLRPLVPEQEFDLNPPTVLQKGSAGRPFVIAAQSERDLLESLSQTSTLYIWGGPALVLGGLAVLLWQLGEK